jgi:hypothetical protein
MLPRSPETAEPTDVRPEYLQGQARELPGPESPDLAHSRAAVACGGDDSDALDVK